MIRNWLQKISYISFDVFDAYIVAHVKKKHNDIYYQIYENREIVENRKRKSNEIRCLIKKIINNQG